MTFTWHCSRHGEPISWVTETVAESSTCWMPGCGQPGEPGGILANSFFVANDPLNTHYEPLMEDIA